MAADVRAGRKMGEGREETSTHNPDLSDLHTEYMVKEEDEEEETEQKMKGGARQEQCNTKEGI